MRTVFGFGMTATLLTLVIGCGQKDNGIDPNSDPYAKKIPATIDGTYKVVAKEYQGSPFADEDVQRAHGKTTFEFSGTKLVERGGGKDDVAQLLFDKTKFPPHITI